MKRILLALALAFAASAAPAAAVESPRWGSFELAVGGYRPNIDAEFGGQATPYRDVFGNGRGLMVRMDAAYSLIVDYGSLDVGMGVGYTEKYGKGFLLDGVTRSDTTGLRLIPVRVHLTYRLDWFANRWSIPLAPYGRISLERYNWWVTNGVGDIAKTVAQAGASSRSGYGATNGWSVSAGVALQLDFFDGRLARDMDNNTGINHTYLFVDFTKSFIKDFGSSTSWDLSDDRKITLSGGILFVF